MLRKGKLTAQHPGGLRTMSVVGRTLPRVNDDDFDDDSRSLPTLSALIDSWFAAERARLTGLRRTRVERVEARLNDFLETASEALLTDPERVLVGLQRDFDPTRAVARTVTSDALPDMLAAFTDELWLPSDPQDRRVQLSMIAKLCREMLDPAYIDRYWPSCGLLDVEARVRALGGPRVQPPPYYRGRYRRYY